MNKVNNIIKKIEENAPVYLKEDFDNVGLMVGDRNKEVKKILLALDCTMKVVEEAINKDIDLIITHHPLIFRKPSNITTDTLQGKKIIKLIKNNISLYSCHTNLDSAECGLNNTIVKLLGFDNNKILEVNQKDCNAGLGRIFKLDETKKLQWIIDIVKNKLKIENLRVVKGNDEINKIAIINGSGQDFIGKAVALGADCIITGDTTYHFASDYKEMGISIIDAGHFSTEWIVFLKVMRDILKEVEGIEIVTSQAVEDPYEFY